MRVSLTIICALLLTASGAVAQDLGTDAQREAGKVIYDKLCAQCHGIDGDGEGVGKHYFRPWPRNFTTTMYKIRSTPSGELPTTEDLKRVIRMGMPYSGMPAWPQFSEDELTNLAYYLKTFSEDFADPDFNVPPIDLPKAPGYSAESAELGKQYWEENKCADCHGNLGRSDGKSAPTLKDEAEQFIRAADLSKPWTFRGGGTREDIYRTFSTGLNGSPMPSYADLIEPADRWHLVDYVWSLSDRKTADYSTLVVASPYEGVVDVSLGEALFDNATPAHFPVFGQIMDPGRMFYPSATEVEVRAVFDADNIAINVVWHDMQEDVSGSNSPALAAPVFAEGAAPELGTGLYSDAVAVQIPTANLAGATKPYFVNGDTRNPMELWFADLAKSEGEIMTGRGAQSVDAVGSIPFVANFDQGRWSVTFVRARTVENSHVFEEGAFSPISFSVWDGFNGERGSARALSSWYYLYLEPTETESALGRIAGFAVLTLLIEVVVIGVVRKKKGNDSQQQAS